MTLGAIALLFAAGAAGWLLWRAARGSASGDARTMTMLKGVTFLGLAAALFAVKLWPLAFMILVAAGAITGIEMWRDRTVRLEEAAGAPRTSNAVMQAEEAASILGLSVDSGADEIRAAHKKLIGQLHPDKGGTNYLAAKINDARDVLLKRNAIEG